MPASQARKNPFFTNPFFMLLLLASFIFVVSAMGYLASPYILEGTSSRNSEPVEKAPPGSSSRRLAEWLDANGPIILGVEFVLMFVSAVAAMATDDWFSKPREPGRSDAE